MKAIIYETTVREDGSLPVPTELHLPPGQTVQVELKYSETPAGRKGNDSLLKMVGLFRSGDRDVSERHDQYLHGKSS